MTSTFVFRTASVTDVGRVRELNEDSVLARPEIGLWAVADGMGGYGGGDVASQAVVAALKTLAPNSSATHLLADFEQEISRANSELRALARARGAAVMGTTLVALLVHGPYFACVWCGDSRVYLSRGGVLTQVSRDHSEVQELIDSGLIRGEQLAASERGHPRTRRERSGRPRDRRWSGLRRRQIPLVQRWIGRARRGRRNCGSACRRRPAAGLRRPSKSDARPRRERQCFDHCRRLRGGGACAILGRRARLGDLLAQGSLLIPVISSSSRARSQ